MLTVPYGIVPSIALETSEYLVVFKPREMHTDGEEAGTLRSWLLERYPQLASVSIDAGLVQRLDYFTAGLLLVAKSNNSYPVLKNLLNEKKIAKQYLALVSGELSGKHIITTFLGSPYRRAKKVKIYTSDPGKKERALQGTTVINPVRSTASWTLVSASAPLARRHQVRAHLAHIGHPLIGDELYGNQHRLQDHVSELTRGFFLFAHEIAIPEIPNEKAAKVTVLHPAWLQEFLP